MECPDCKNGKGYKEITVYNNYIYDDFLRVGVGGKTVKEWCKRCRGKGEVPYSGDRSGVAWEGE